MYYHKRSLQMTCADEEVQKIIIYCWQFVRSGCGTNTGCPTTDTGCPTTDTGCPTTNTGCPTTNTGCPTTDTFV